MNCPFCGNEKHNCIDSRPRHGGIYRRKVCLNCGERFSTFEISISEQRSRNLPVEYKKALLKDFAEERGYFLVEKVELKTIENIKISRALEKQLMSSPHYVSDPVSDLGGEHF